ncbi:hypothetical protein Xbed_02706 [Xenorhabdus beddingii]|uniref:A-factor biosynthesis hotdog domain-containing protein n=1 Tax=Xenorhabdus beddingii TaxID=40578 RepID=A0A1Y2SJZ7_9GAMM|nr:AfsA-related hotdog domain-containing protein [Xenorhabdus beddingii]OTA19011.1 hypothetical protein Xbed_02706 [Xenorhabdus beddingii]
MKQLAITPYILHKDHEDDVFLMRFESVLPAYITEDVIIEFMKLANEDEVSDFLSIYKKNNSFYVLKDVPFCLPKNSIKYSMKNTKINLSDFYILEDETWILKQKYLPRFFREYLRAFICNGEFSINNELIDRVSLSLSRYGKIPVSRTNSYIIKNDTEHYFFYRKEHEHVPGLMLIEMARQAMYHHFYSYSGYSRGSVSISISSLSVDFFAFTESSYELEVIVSTASDIAYNCPRHVDMIASFYQNGKSVACVNLKGNVFKLNVFKRVRTINFPEGHWFKLFSRSNKLVMLMDNAANINIVIIDAISISGVRLNSHNIITNNKKWVVIQSNERDILKLPIGEIKIDELNNIIIINFASLDRHQEYELSEFIKINCYFLCDIHPSKKIS